MEIAAISAEPVPEAPQGTPAEPGPSPTGIGQDPDDPDLAPEDLTGPGDETLPEDSTDELLVVGRMPDPASLDRPWLASYPPGVPDTYQYPAVPLTRFLDDAAADFPHTIATEFLGGTLTYRQLTDQVDSFAGALRGLGVRSGDRVGVILPNCPQHVVAIFAILRVGAIVVESNPLHPTWELEHELRDAGCRVVVFLDALYPKVQPLRARLPQVEHWIGTGIQEALPFLKRRLFPLKGRRDGTYLRIPSGDGVTRMTDLIKRTPPASEQASIDPRNDVAMLVYTGGTTGVSKGVMLTHYNLVVNAFQTRLWIPDIQAGREKVLAVMPLHHAYGLTTCLTLGVLSGATLVLLPRFELDEVLGAIDRHRPTLLPGVAAVYAAINDAPSRAKFDLRSIRVCLSGAEPLPGEVARTFEEATGGKLREGYGLTETSPLTHANPIYGKAKVGSIGLPLPDTITTLVDLADPTRPAQPSQPGELAIWGPQVMKGYWNRPQETQEVLRDGWLLTGDVGWMDEEGYFTFADRKNDTIVVGGRTIFPGDVEDVLVTHAKVEQAVVAGIPDQYLGSTVKAFVVLKQGQTATAQEIDAFCRERLAIHKVPKAYQFRDALPETAAGKVMRHHLVEAEHQHPRQADAGANRS